jgi:hypothetical protein
VFVPVVHTFRILQGLHRVVFNSCTVDALIVHSIWVPSDPAFARHPQVYNGTKRRLEFLPVKLRTYDLRVESTIIAK